MRQRPRHWSAIPEPHRSFEALKRWAATNRHGSAEWNLRTVRKKAAPATPVSPGTCCWAALLPAATSGERPRAGAAAKSLHSRERHSFPIARAECIRRHRAKRRGRCRSGPRLESAASLRECPARSRTQRRIGCRFFERVAARNSRTGSGSFRPGCSQWSRRNPDLSARLRSEPTESRAC